MADVQVSNHGSILLFQPLTQVAQDWIRENVIAELLWLRSFRRDVDLLLATV